MVHCLCTFLAQMAWTCECAIKYRSHHHDPYSCEIKAKQKYFTGWKTVGHIPCKIWQYAYFFIKQGGSRVYGKLKSLKYKIFPILSGGLEVSLLLKFESRQISHGYNKGAFGKFLFFRFHRGSSCK